VDLREEPGYVFFMGRRGLVPAEETRFVLLIGREEYIRSQQQDIPTPTATRLLQSWPNPFRSGSVIRYEVAGPAEVRIRIYDVQGKLVDAIEASHSRAGRYEAAWGGRSSRGRTVTPGVYFYRMEAPGYTETRKMIKIE